MVEHPVESDEHSVEADVSTGDHATSHVVVLACVGLLVGTTLRFVETQLLPLARQRWPRVQLPPYTLSVFLTGALASVIDDAAHGRHQPVRREADPLADALDSAQFIDPHVILLVLLPPLIYESASNMNYHVFRRVGASAFLLAFPGVLIQLFIVGVVLRYSSGYGEDGAPWDWNVSLMLGSIVTATDPVAVVSTLHALGAPEKLSDVIDGESLLNDGSAMVMFSVWMHNIRQDALGGESHSFGSGALVFARLCVGGAALGVACFYAVVTWLRFVENDFRVEVGILLLSVYACFGIAELVAGVSGVLALVTFGLLMARRGKYAFSPHATAVAESVMPMLAHFTETIIFFVAGIAAWSALAGPASTVAWWHALPLYVLLHAVRALTVGLLYPILSRLGYSLTLKESAIIIFAGLRGAVGLSLSLLVVHDDAVSAADRERVHYHVAGTVALTMLINGTTTSALYDRLKLYPANRYRDVLVRGVVAKLETEAMASIREALDAHWLFAQADWEVVQLLVPDFTGLFVQDDNRLKIPASTRIDIFGQEVVRRIVTTAPTREAIVADSARPGGPAARVLAWLEALDSRDPNTTPHQDHTAGGSSGFVRASGAAEEPAPPAPSPMSPLARLARPRSHRPGRRGSWLGAGGASGAAPQPVAAAAVDAPCAAAADAAAAGGGGGASRLRVETEPVAASAYDLRLRSLSTGSLPVGGGGPGGGTSGGPSPGGRAPGAPPSAPRMRDRHAANPRAAWRAEAAAFRPRAGSLRLKSPGASPRATLAGPASGIRSCASMPAMGAILGAAAAAGASAAQGAERCGDGREAIEIAPLRAEGDSSSFTGGACAAAADSASLAQAEPHQHGASGVHAAGAQPAAALALPGAAAEAGAPTDRMTGGALGGKGAESDAAAEMVSLRVDGEGGADTPRHDDGAAAQANAANGAGGMRRRRVGGGAAGGATAADPRSAGGALGPRRASADCSLEEKRDEIVTQLFAVLRRLYFEAYEHKQLDGASLAVLVEALSSGEEYLAEHPAAEAGRAFELELDVLLYELPLLEPRWARTVQGLPLVGEVAWRHALFQRTYEVTEALAGFVHAHAELAHACAGDSRKAAVVEEAVAPVLARAKEELHDHRLRNWSVVTLQLNLLTARAANETKRNRVRTLAQGGDLTDADVTQICAVIDSTMYSIDTLRYALFAPTRFHAVLRHVVHDLGYGTHDSYAQALARPVPEIAPPAIGRWPSERSVSSRSEHQRGAPGGGGGADGADSGRFGRSCTRSFGRGAAPSDPLTGAPPAGGPDTLIAPPGGGRLPTVQIDAEIEEEGDDDADGGGESYRRE